MIGDTPGDSELPDPAKVTLSIWQSGGVFQHRQDEVR